MINISLKRTLPAYQSSHYAAKVNCMRGGLDPVNRGKVARPSTCLLTTTEILEFLSSITVLPLDQHIIQHRVFVIYRTMANFSVLVSHGKGAKQDNYFNDI